MKNYDDLFDLRGSAYDLAMRSFPNARAAEFLQLLQGADLRPGARVADVPAGGGYLQSYLPADCQYLGHEPCGSFDTRGGEHGAGAARVPLLPLPWADASVDVAVSLAGIHHIENKGALFIEMRRVVRPGGRLVVSDVAAGSRVANFLDGYVGDNNSTGHEGLFLDEATQSELTNAGWNLLAAAQVDFHWVFDDRQAMATFCHKLFDLCKSTVNDTLLAIEQELGVDDLPDGGVGMRWGLMTLVAQP